MAERLVIIGGDAGGMAAVSQVRKQRPDIEIVALERGNWTSYSACGIPYLVGGDVERVDQLVARTPQEFRDRFGVDVRMRHEATAIDLDAGTVEVRDLTAGGHSVLGFDQLLIGTGGVPVRPPLPGIDLPFVHGVQTLDDALHLLAHVEQPDCERIVVVGGGYIGIEIAEALVQRGKAVTLVEQAPQVMPSLDPPMGALVTEALRRHGVDVRCGVAVTGFDEGLVHTAAGDLACDRVLLGIGVAPNSGLARDAGLALGLRGAIRVDRRQQTSVPGVWAAGDCCESHHLVSGRPVYVALGTVANKQARVAGINIGGGYATFPGVLGTAIAKFCDIEVARTGLSSWEAQDAGFAVTTTTIESTTKAGYFPGATRLTVRLVVEPGSGRLLGAQIVGGDDSAKRIDACAVAITAGMSVHDVVNLDLAYAPPFSSVWDPVLVAAREALKRL